MFLNNSEKIAVCNSKGKIRRSLPVMPQRVFTETVTPPKNKAAPFHLIGGDSSLVFIIEGSRLFAVEPDFHSALKSGDTAAENALLEMLSPLPKKQTDDFALLEEPTALSLNIAQNCNLSCAYCYADEGKFGGKASFMHEETAFAAIDNLLASSDGRPLTIGFIGGEPLINRKVLHASVAYARRQAEARRIKVRFSITTNGTLLQTADVELFRENAFAVTVSLDGDEKTNNRLRRSNNGTSSYAQALESLRPLLQNPGRANVSARSTITRSDLRVLERVESLARAGFTEIGVSPLRQSPDSSLALRENDWSNFLGEMIRAGESEILRLQRGEKLRFSNFAAALQQIHQGTSRNLPCGSAINYVSVSAEGNYFTCHRTIDNEFFALGDTANGLSTEARRKFLRGREVDRQEPCVSCWARYLCGGGCHAEVLAVGRGGCDYIRGWLEFCLRSYDRLLTENLLPFNF